MIPNFSQIIKQDLINCYDYALNKKPHDEELNKKVKLAALHIIATLGIALGTLMTISAIPFITTAPISSTLWAGCGIGIYALFRHEFMTSNYETAEKIFHPGFGCKLAIEVGAKFIAEIAAEVICKYIRGK